MASRPVDPFPYKNISNHHVTSKATGEYNCVAWALHKSDQVVWLDEDELSGWPPTIDRSDTLAAFKALFEVSGFVPCSAGNLEDQQEKVALYVRDHRVTHVARQLANGQWTSKLGPAVDISHESPSVLEGPRYGTVLLFMKRDVPPKRPKLPAFYPEPSPLINLSGGSLFIKK